MRFALCCLITVFYAEVAIAIPSVVRGTVADESGAAVQGATVTLTVGNAERETKTDARGAFTFRDVPPGTAMVVVAGARWAPEAIEVGESRDAVTVILRALHLSEQITVQAQRPRLPRITSATKTDMPMRDVPQAVTVVTRKAIAEQSMQSMADVARAVPGIQMAQGEGNRDAAVFRGNSSTSDFFVDGMRDDVQYFRDLYNVDRVEAIKGPNAMIFGRGGVGGVINRVMRRADWGTTRELTLQGGSFGNRRIAADVGQPIRRALAGRVAAVFEESDSYRDGVTVARHGINPTFAIALGSNTTLRAGYEFFHDRRTADRGISSYRGRPVATGPSTFFGNPDESYSNVDVSAWSASMDHKLASGATLRSALWVADYDKMYQNVFPGSMNAAGTQVSISGYNLATRRRNAFSQNDAVFVPRTGALSHTIAAGFELGRQINDNFRETAYFTSIGANTTTIMVPIERPMTNVPITFRQGPTDADNRGIATVAAGYVQDQIEFSPKLQVIAGLRYDRFNIDFNNHRTSDAITTTDNLLAPRLAVVYKPRTEMSAYASYTVSYQPRAGEQLASLTASVASLAPEKFLNYEAGFKWDIGAALQMTSAVYQLDRTNVVAPDPTNSARSILVDGQRTSGIEMTLNGELTARWSMLAAYAYQNGEITTSLSSSALAGARLPHVPRHALSLWNRYDVSHVWGLGAGITHRGDVYTSTDNSVTLPAYTRTDVALFLAVSPRMQAQVNVENLLDARYYAFAHNNTNITPGSPRAVRLSWTMRF